MLKHAIYTNIATCQELNRELSPRHPAIETESPWREQLLSDMKYGPETKKLLAFLLRHDVRVASLSPWQPSTTLTTLSVGNMDEVSNCTGTLQKTAPANENREDQKYGYRLPSCTNGNLNFALHEPKLEWLGVGVHHLDGHDAVIGSLEWKINGVAVDIFKHQFGEMKHAQDWTRLPKTFPSRPETYQVSFCNTEKSDDLVLRKLVGVMMPHMTAREKELVEVMSL
ncbi:expressed unknown protein [Seminavis robusta]|uniref:Uncharacterized protein n=1 Tax=Seminavis robusta TaxID=568900 RepID=A0A9N8HRC6_9STRA|nr:expressed unknown protein [Seminavis robusta]|eukprot:Sro1381_g267870.1 n/a (226) ;mRNA; f:24565-25242